MEFTSSTIFQSSSDSPYHLHPSRTSSFANRLTDSLTPTPASPLPHRRSGSLTPSLPEADPFFRTYLPHPASDHTSPTMASRSLAHVLPASNTTIRSQLSSCSSSCASSDSADTSLSTLSSASLHMLPTKRSANTVSTSHSHLYPRANNLPSMNISFTPLVVIPPTEPADKTSSSSGSSSSSVSSASSASSSSSSAFLSSAYTSPVTIAVRAGPPVMDLPPSTPRLARFVLPGPALAPQRHLGPGTEVRYPPANFATVAPGIFRSSFPNRDNFEFLRSLGLKSVLTLVQEKYPSECLKFYQQEGIKFMQFSIPGNKEPFVHIPEDKIRLALRHVLDVRNHPMLIHCNKGKHRTGCLVGCLRKLQHWSSTAIFDEYRRYAFPKSRNMDQQFIELFDLAPVWDEIDPDFAPEWLDLSV